MSPKERDLEDRMRATIGREHTVQRRVGEGRASAAGERATQRTVRLTVDLTEAQHRALRHVAVDHGTNASEVIRALVDELAAGSSELGAILTRRLGSGSH